MKAITAPRLTWQQIEVPVRLDVLRQSCRLEICVSKFGIFLSCKTAGSEITDRHVNESGEQEVTRDSHEWESQYIYTQLCQKWLQLHIVKL